VLAFTHHIPDIAEYKEITGDRTRQAADVVGVSGHKPRREPFCKMRRRIFFRHSLVHAPRQFLVEGNVFRPGQIDKAARKIGIVCRQCRLDILRNDGLVIP
jgi:hypothetical protein